MADNQLTGGLVNYYLAPVKHPQRPEQPAYVAECEDISDALKMTPNEFCEFKGIWRTAAARLDNGKPNHKALYDAEKRLHYAGRDVAIYRREAGVLTKPPVTNPVISPEFFILDGERFDLSQWWVRALQDTTDNAEHLRAVAVAMRVLKAVLPKS